MKKTAYHKPYKKRKGRTLATFRHAIFNSKPGVYIVRKGKKIVYIGHSQSNVYKTLYRHFQSWNDRSQKRVTYPKFSPTLTVRIVLCTTKQAPRLENILIRKYKPVDNTLKLEFIFKDQESTTKKQFSDSKTLNPFYYEDTGEDPF